MNDFDRDHDFAVHQEAIRRHRAERKEAEKLSPWNIFLGAAAIFTPFLLLGLVLPPSDITDRLFTCVSGGLVCAILYVAAAISDRHSKGL